MEVIVNFNSTMVRLGAIYPTLQSIHLLISIPLWFDWETFSTVMHLPTTVFQFHYGSIGSAIELIKNGANFKFQFHYGSIGSCAIVACCIAFDNFNSTMVRLGESKISLLESKNLKFQFHYGSIGSINDGH